MKLIIVVVLLAVLGYFGYQYVQEGNAPPSVERAVQDAREQAGQALDAAGEAARSAGQALQQGAGNVLEGAEQVGERAGQAAQGGAQDVRQTAQNAADEARGGLDVGRELEEFVGSVRKAASDLNNSATAEAVREEVNQLNEQLKGLAPQVEQLPETAQRGFASAASAALPTVRDLATRIEGMQGGQSLKPTLDAIVAKLEEWSRPPT